MYHDEALISQLGPVFKEISVMEKEVRNLLCCRYSKESSHPGIIASQRRKRSSLYTLMLAKSVISLYPTTYLMAS